jgi:hypothetical protein
MIRREQLLGLRGQYRYGTKDNLYMLLYSDSHTEETYVLLRYRYLCYIYATIIEGLF